MILQALVDYYEVQADAGKLPRPGWSTVSVSWALSISAQGELLDVIPLQQEVEQGKKTVLRPRQMVVPEQFKRSSGVCANFLCDNAAYLLGIDSKGRPERTRECYEAAVALHRKVLAGVEGMTAMAILAFFERWDTEMATEHPLLIERLEDIKKGGNLLFRVEGHFAHEDPEIRKRWQSFGGSNAETASICLVTGCSDVPARLHPSIKGIRGGQATGTSLVSFNAEAYCSYGKEQGQNAPVGEYAAFAYTTVLNALVRNRKNTMLLGDTTVVLWSQSGSAAAEELMHDSFDMSSDTMSESDLMAAMEQLAKGRPVRLAEEEIDPDMPFYILGLAPNAGRLAVRFFLRNTLGAFSTRLLEHQQRLEIVRPAYDKREHLSFYWLLQETVNMNSRDKNPSSVLTGELLRAVLTGDRYPATLLNGVNLRIRAEREISRGRAAIIKAYYLRNPHPDCPKEALTVEVNDSKCIPYCLGQAFSILEAIQEAASPDLNATIKDKYFDSAAATPSIIFPILIRLTNKHLRKLEKGRKIYYEKQLGDLLGNISGYPTRMTLPQQGVFQLGYYHQTQKRYEKKKEDNGNV